MNKLIEWLKQARTKLDNVLTQRRLDKQWEKYQEEEFTTDMLPVVIRGSQGKSAAELTARMWTDIIAAGVVERVINENVLPRSNIGKVKIVVKRKNWDMYMEVIHKYSVKVQELRVI